MNLANKHMKHSDHIHYDNLMRHFENYIPVRTVPLALFYDWNKKYVFLHRANFEIKFN